MDPEIDDSQSSAPDDAESEASTSKRRPPSRPTKLRSETIAAICAGVRNGLPREHAAATAGVPPSTFHSWMALGRELEERHADRSAWTERERLCAELLAAVERAETDSLERLQAIVVAAATNHRVYKTVVSQTQRLDKDGELRWCESRRCEITEGPHVGAALELLKHRTLEFSQWATKQEAELMSREDREIGERLARDLRARPLTLDDEDDGEDAAALTWPEPATTDDDSDYEYAAWTGTLRGVPSDGYDDSVIDIRDDPESQ